MFELMDLDVEIPVKIPLLDIKVADFQVDTAVNPQHIHTHHTKIYIYLIDKEFQA